MKFTILSQTLMVGETRKVALATLREGRLEEGNRLITNTERKTWMFIFVNYMAAVTLLIA